MNITKNHIEYSLDDDQKTAKVIGTDEFITGDILIPRSIILKNQEYIVTCISKNAFYENESISSIKFADDSEVTTIEKDALWDSLINTIFLPSSVIELKDGWCDYTKRLNTIIIDSKNPRYSTYNDKFIIGKSSLSQDYYDTLVFANRDIEIAIIPNFIEIIGPYSFNECVNLDKVVFAEDSKARVISKQAFSSSSIRSISIPPSVTHICKAAFFECENLSFLKIPENSELKSIEKLAFSATDIFEFTFPSKLVKLENRWCHNTPFLYNIRVMPKNPLFMCLDNKIVLKKSSIENVNYDVLVFAARNITQAKIPSFVKIVEECAFESCCVLCKVEFVENSELQVISHNSFYTTSIEIINIPQYVTKIGDFSFYDCQKLRRIEIPNESELQIIGNRAFAKSSIESFYMTQHVKEIGKFAFDCCSNLQIIEIDENSKLKSIDSSVIYNTKNAIIMIPVKLQLEFTYTNEFEYLYSII